MNSNSNSSGGVCGCYTRVKKRTPVNLFNSPGLSSLKYRIGTHSQFKADMVELISRKSALKNLSTRENDDLGIALLDVWATIADVLTFYQERIVNEGYLRTATERRSVLELARTVGYELKSGVAASVPLVFTVESFSSSPLRSRVDEGTKVMSVPGQDEKLQIFETVETIEAKAALNDLRPLQFTPQIIDIGCTELYLKGVTTHLVPGDAILLVGQERVGNPESDIAAERVSNVASEHWDFRFLDTVTVHPTKNYTIVTWLEPLGCKTTWQKGGRSDDVPSLPAKENLRVFVFRQRASFFGYNAPNWKLMHDSIKKIYDDNDKSNGDTYQGGLPEWPGFRDIFSCSSDADNAIVCLDSVYTKVLPGSWIVFVGQRKKRQKKTVYYVELCRVKKVETGACSDFMLNAKTTKLELDMTGKEAKKYLSGFLRRDTVIFCVSDPLDLFCVSDPLDPNGVVGVPVKPSTKDVSGDVIELDRQVSEFQVGQKVIIQGKEKVNGVVGGVVSEIVSITKVSDSDPTEITLDRKLSHVYDLASVHIYGNVAFATHGETVRETLGSGDSLAVNQQFRLKKTPLTFVSANTTSGAKSTLKVFVNTVQWREMSTLYGLGSQSFDYFVRVEDNGDTLVNFGDGITGARLPSGVENVTAVYRSGIGLQGAVAANKLTLLTKKPFGVKSVTNPIAASGAASPERMDDAKLNAPSVVLTLDRIVSLKDYESFARKFLGIAKASAQTKLVHKTEEDEDKEADVGEVGKRVGVGVAECIVQLIVAPEDAQVLDEGSMLYQNLCVAVDGVRAYGQKVRIESFNPLYFDVVVYGLCVDSNHQLDEVKANVRVALVNAFSFEKRSFKQAVTRDEVLSIIQAVEGVIYVHDVTAKLSGASTTDDETGASHSDEDGASGDEVSVVDVGDVATSDEDVFGKDFLLEDVDLLMVNSKSISFLEGKV